MKTFQKTVSLLLIALSVAFSSCSKSEDTPTPATPTTPPSGSVNSLANQTWSLDGVVYDAVEGNDLDWGRDVYGTYYLTANKFIGAAEPYDTTHTTNIRMGTVNMASGTYSLSTNSSTMPANTVNPYAGQYTAPVISVYDYISGGNATVTNSATSFNIKINDAQLRGKKYNSNFTVIKPTIPAANAAFTVPTGITANSITVNGGAAISMSPQLRWQKGKLDGSSALSATPKGLIFGFARSLPLSGTYNIIAKTAVKPAPGQITIEYNDFGASPVKAFKSAAGGTATVVNTNDVISVTINGVVLVDLFGTSQTATVTGNLTY